MPLVTITGNAWDHGQVPIPASRRPELLFRPNGSNVGVGLLAGVESKAELNPATGYFTVQLFSDVSHRIRYTPVLRWLTNPEESDPEKWSYGYAEWPFEIIPDTGGDITGIINEVVGIGLVYVGPDAPTTARRNQLQLDPVTWDLYERRVLWP